MPAGTAREALVLRVPRFTLGPQFASASALSVRQGSEQRWCFLFQTDPGVQALFMGLDILCRKYSKETSQVGGLLLALCLSPWEPVSSLPADDLAPESRPQGLGGGGAPCPCAVFPAAMPFALLRVPVLLLQGDVYFGRDAPLISGVWVMGLWLRYLTLSPPGSRRAPQPQL